MMSVAYPLRRDEREAVAAFLGKGADEPRLPAQAMCTADRAHRWPETTGSGWTRLEPRAGQHAVPDRGSAPACSAADVPRLELKWAFGFPGDVTAFAAPTVLAARCSSAAPPARCRRSTRGPAASTGSYRRAVRCDRR